MKKESKLESAMNRLAEAAEDFNTACTEVYQAYKGLSNAVHSGRPQVYLQDDVQQLVASKYLTVVQARAISGAFSGWRPPKPAPVRSVPVTGRSGGAA
jgi:hypothetical protein